MDGYTCIKCGRFIETRILPSNGICKICREDPNKIFEVKIICKSKASRENLREAFIAELEYMGEIINFEVSVNDYQGD
jgi:hypothetical protein